MKMKFYVALVVLFVAVAFAAVAETNEDYKSRVLKEKQEHASLEQKNAQTTDLSPSGTKGIIGMVTGSRTGTYYRIGKDIADALKEAGIAIDVKESSGSIDNIGRIGSKENAALGIVQSDVLGFLKRSDAEESKKMTKNLRMVFPLFKEEVHLVASKQIKTFDELAGKTIAVGETGSGSWLTAMNLFAMGNISPKQILRVPPEEGLVAVLRGNADAMLFVSGKPVKLFENLSRLSERMEYASLLDTVHLLPLNKDSFYKEYQRAEITPKDYPFVTETVPTLAVNALLVSFNFSDMDSQYAAARCTELRGFAQGLRESIGKLKEAAHPKWKEVNLDMDVMVWESDPCIRPDTLNVRLENELLNILKTE